MGFVPSSRLRSFVTANHLPVDGGVEDDTPDGRIVARHIEAQPDLANPSQHLINRHIQACCLDGITATLKLVGFVHRNHDCGVAGGEKSILGLPEFTVLLDSLGIAIDGFDVSTLRLQRDTVVQAVFRGGAGSQQR